MLLLITYALIAYLPVIAIVVGIPLLVVGLIRQKNQKSYSKIFTIVGGGCIGICIIFFMGLFVLDIFGMGFEPNWYL